MTTILKSLALYRIEEKAIALKGAINSVGGYGEVRFGETGRSSWTSKSGTLVAVKQLCPNWTKAESKVLALVRAIYVSEVLALDLRGLGFS